MLKPQNSLRIKGVNEKTSIVDALLDEGYIVGVRKNSEGFIIDIYEEPKAPEKTASVAPNSVIDQITEEIKKLGQAGGGTKSIIKSGKNPYVHTSYMSKDNPFDIQLDGCCDGPAIFFNNGSISLSEFLGLEEDN